MAVRLRLRRMGKKKQPFYRIVAIDSRESRDGKYLENVGYYNPLPDPVDFNVKADRALYWLQKGAQPSDTVKSLLRKKGIMIRYDLLRRGKNEEEIAQELQKWEGLQAERDKRLEAARIQAGNKQKSEEKNAEVVQEADNRVEEKAETETISTQNTDTGEGVVDEKTAEAKEDERTLTSEVS